MLEVRLIGTFDIQCDGKPVVLSSRAAQSLFAYIILTAGTLHRREKLAGMLWPEESEQKARAYLRNELWRIRKVLPHASNVEYLLADNLTVGFNPASAYWLDVAGLKSLSDASSVEELMQSLSNYQGEFLPGFYEDWVVVEREHLQVLFEQKMACLLELLEKEQRWEDILEWAERWISFGEAPEAAYRALMLAYEALGDHAKVASTFERCKKALRQLDLEPSEETHALAFKRNSKIKIPIPLTSFIGREKELKEVADLFSKSRLITLTGSGGVGKTRLAIQVVVEVLDLFPDGVWFLDLAPLSDPALVATTLINLLGLRESTELSASDMLVNYFRSRTALVIFDNCEHLIESCSQLISSLLASCEQLSILATSRETLRVSGEITYRVPSLEIPKSDLEVSIDSFSKIESMRLFIERAALASSHFAINSHDRVLIAQICQQLDGIPLALELAAARTNVLTVEQISNHLDDRFNLLTRGLRSALPRHQTLRAMIEWSYDLLTKQERILFKRLAVFMGGWTLDAAREVCSSDEIEASEVLDLLSQLVNKSLVLVETLAGESRYHCLETIRQFAREKLLETNDLIRLQDLHLKCYLNLAETAEPHLRRGEQIEWLKRLDLEHDNLRAALAWAIGKPSAELALRLVGSLGTFWFLRAYWMEGAKWLDQALGRTWNENSKAEKAARAKALYQRAFLADAGLDEYDIMKISAESALALCEEVEDAWGIAFSHALLAHHKQRLGMDITTIKTSLEKSLNGFQRLGDAGVESLILRWVAFLFIHRGAGTREESLEIMQRSMDRALNSGDRYQIAYSLEAFAELSMAYSQWDEAERLLQEAEQLYAEIGSSSGIIGVRFLYARIFFVGGNLENAKAEAKLVIEYLNQIGERRQQGQTISLLALMAGVENDFQAAVIYAQKALELAREMGLPQEIAWNLILVGIFKYRLGKIEDAMQYVGDSLEFVHRGEVGDNMVVNIFVHLAGLLVEKKPRASIQILAFTKALEQSSAIYSDNVLDKPYFDRFLSAARSKLSETEFTLAWEAGCQMSLSETVAYALKELQ